MRLPPLAPTFIALTVPFALAGCASDVAFNCVGDAPMCAILAVTADERPLASGVEISRVTLAQGVQMDLLADGEAVTDPSLPVIAGRDVFVRIFVTPTEDFDNREVTARVYLWSGDEVVAAGQADGRPGEGTDAALDSTINVFLEGEGIPPGDLTWSVEIVETAGASRVGGNNDGAEYPPRGAIRPTLPVQDVGESMRIYLMPVEWNYDGSGRLPDTSPIAVDEYRRYMYSIFPVADVEIEVGEPFPWDQGIDGGLGGWSTLLQAVGAERGPRDVDDDQYIYGLFTPYEAPQGGVAGLSNVGGTPLDSGARASIGVAYRPGGGAGTMAHELGHAAGRLHAPCGGAAGPDPEYPHDNARLGSFGYDLTTGDLKDPEAYADLMSYCGPEWVSDYNFEKLFVRQQGIYEQVLGGGDGGGTTARTAENAWRKVWLHPDGRVVEGELVYLPEAPTGEFLTAEIDGRSVRGVLSPFDHVPGGILYVPGESIIEEIAVEGGPATPVMPFDSLR